MGNFLRYREKDKKWQIVLKKIKVVFVGNKCHKDLENVFTLSRSNLDEYDGILEYIFYLVIDKEPIQ